MFNFSNKKHIKYKYMFLNLNILHVLGLWPSSDSNWSFGVYFICAFLTSSSIALFCISVYIKIFFTTGDLNVLTDVLSVALTNSSNCCKLVPFWFMRKKLIYMIQVLHDDLFPMAMKHMSNEKEVIIQKSLHHIKLLTIFYTSWYFVTTSTWLSTSLVHMPSSEDGNLNETVVHRTLPFPGWFPYDETVSPFYEYSYVFQAFGSMMDTIYAAIMDCFYAAFIILVTTQFQLLAVSVKDIKQNAIKQLTEKYNCEQILDEADNSNLSEDKYTNYEPRELNKEMNDILSECIKHHQAIYRYVKDLQRLLGPIMLLECIVMSFILCTITYQATILPFDNLKFLTMILFLGCEGGRIFIYCKTGTDLQWHSVLISKAAYESDWYNADIKFKRGIGIMMVRSLKQAELKAFHFTTMTLDLFTNTCKTGNLMEHQQVFALLFSASVLLCVLTIGPTLTAWIHWSEILDTCVDRHCGCPLNGVSNSVIFSGGPVEFCYFASLASVPAFIFNIVVAGYYLYQAIINKYNLKRRPERRQKESYRLQRWLPFLIMCCVNEALIFADAIVLITGYYKTCGEYRKTVVRYLSAATQVSSVIYDRLTCGSAIDFMDYLEPKTRPRDRKGENVYIYPGEDRDLYRGDLINTAAALQIAIISAWINTVIMCLIIAVILRTFSPCYRKSTTIKSELDKNRQGTKSSRTQYVPAPTLQTNF